MMMPIVQPLAIACLGSLGPVYLKGFKPGKNWVQLEFLDEREIRQNVFNNTVRLITYETKGKIPFLS